MDHKQQSEQQKKGAHYQCIPLHQLEPGIVDLVIRRMDMKVRCRLRRTSSEMNEWVEHLYVPGEYSAKNLSVALEKLPYTVLFNIMKRMDKDCANNMRMTCDHVNGFFNDYRQSIAKHWNEQKI